MIFAIALRTSVLAMLAVPAATQAQGVAPPGGGGPILVHDLSHFVDIFEEICIKPASNPQTQLDAAKRSRWSFKPETGPMPDSQSLQSQSVGLSVRPRGGRQLCSVSGLSRDTSFEGAVATLQSRFQLGDPVYGLEAGAIEVALWGHKTPRTISVSATPKKLRQANGSVRAGPAHVVISLSYQGNATR